MQDFAETPAVVLAGGLGMRLRAVVKDRPKVLAEVRGRPFIAYLLDQLAASGIRNVVLCVGYLGDQVQSAFGKAYGDIRLSYSQETCPLGTAGALRNAFAHMSADSWLVMNGDSFCDVNLVEFWTYHVQTRLSASLLLTWVSDTSRFGRVAVDADGRARAFEEKTGQREAGWINAGLYLIHRRLIESISINTAVSIERDIFPAMIDRGIGTHRCKAPFLDIGTPESYAAAQRFFEVPRNAVLQPEPMPNLRYNA